MTFTTTEQVYNAAINGVFTHFNYLQQMDIIIKLQQAISGQNNHIANAIRLSIKEEPAAVTIAMVKDMAEDNETTMQDILGLELVKRIML